MSVDSALFILSIGYFLHFERSHLLGSQIAKHSGGHLLGSQA